MLLLDQVDRLLLLAVQDDPADRPAGSAAPAPVWWVTAGGGLEPGEDLRAAALREVEEETTVRLPAEVLGAHVWTRRAEHGYSDRVVDQQEDFLVARLPHGQVVDVGASSELAARWWSVAQLRAEAPPTWPLDLADRLAELLAALARGPWVGPPLRLPDAVEDAPCPRRPVRQPGG